MSSALLKKSLEIVEASSSKGNSSKKKGKNFVPESHKIMKVVKKKGKIYKQNQIEGSGRKLTIRDVQRRMETSKERVERTVDKLLKLHSSALEDEDAEEIARRAKTGHYVLPPQQETVEPDSIFTEEDFKKFEEDYFDDTI
ncbi:active regulator of SIRT1-like [Lutzomyia longipalpis]|uniref:active regulator of SIRT1-like n=1 Tax=Lutzomyia longipalpis TaxID=7200 RepID=UPI00248415C8|nr:active regulator of SIRT1-like [Lutzomyia longipalpis]